MSARPRRRPSDPDIVGMLIADLGRPGTPTAAEERAYAARIAAGGEDGAAARRELAGRNVPLVIRIARGIQVRADRPGLMLADLVGAGCVGLVYATRDFHAGHRFSTYASDWIRREILRHLVRDRLVHVPEYISNVLRTGYLPAKDVRQDEAKYLACLSAGRAALAAETEFDPADLPTGERWPDDSGDPADLAADAELLRKLPGWLAALADEDGRLARLLVLRFGLDGAEPRTLQAAGTALGGLTRERARQLERQALDRLREIAGAYEAAVRGRDERRKARKGA